MTDSGKVNSKLRLLVAIASYGRGHLPYLKHIIQTYQNTDMDVDVVVLSDAPKELGPKVEVIVGLPTNNPWSLPFAHKAVFADRVNEYDLFVFSEDDNDVTEGHIDAFLKITPHLKADEVAGYLRYEVDPAGNWSMDEAFGAYHWKPESVRKRDSYSIAEFTNEHAGFYILTQSQLKRAIASGGFLRGPCRGRYNWPETAATDPYTNCGFRKVVCISNLQDFLIHHMPNQYCSRHYVSLDSFQKQVETLMAIRDGFHPACTLSDVEAKLPRGLYSKSYYEDPSEDVICMVPTNAENILSVGCGWGATEAKLQEQGARVTAVPLDSVIGVVAAQRGIEVIYGTWDECLTILGGRRFDCVFMTNILHLQRNPGRMLEQCSKFVGDGGTLVAAGPNFGRLQRFIKRALRIGDYSNFGGYDRSGLSPCGPRTLSKYAVKAGLRLTAVRWLNHSMNLWRARVGGIALGSLTARDWIIQARR